MAIKDILHQCRPVQLYVVLFLSICYFSLQMVLSHMTHGLTLLMSSYHMLCNIFALTGCLITMKQSHCTALDENMDYALARNSNLAAKNDQDKFTCVDLSVEEKSLRNIEIRERKLRNTFGWTRIDILTMLIVCIFLASLSFSLLVEALQTLIHIDHQDTMHLPVPVMILGFMGLILNGICYLFIGGYTTRQGNFLHMTSNGDVILDSKKGNDEGEQTECGIPTLSVANNMEENNPSFRKEKQSLVQMFRDISSTMFVILCAVIIYMSKDDHTAKFIDPILSIFSCVVLATLSYPYMKESCLILLQTIPASIDIDIFEKNLETKFPEIISYHDLHIWQLTSNKFVSTVHIKFKSQQLYTKIIDDVRNFFIEQGITIVTIQPEFQDIILPSSIECLVQCNAIDCVEKVCCQQSRNDLREIILPSNQVEKQQEIKLKNLSSTGSMAERSQSANNIACCNSTDVSRNIIYKHNSTDRTNNKNLITTVMSSSPNINF
ncbi:calcium/manganese antiporter SLC30A10 [Eupeodes corollae]|uniref:calcium/manganese antiporter SLC30A10 n=1 Tax=Eupeodes corollae TaxID=290404 RepID=UPI002490A01C|nr:calcium/manganese antiporter SLC30A10 [Eupeodes corollae]XP_055908109.1 calcium/manganese antiporter SLC30A10 [Eupeodes corollae]